MVLLSKLRSIIVDDELHGRDNLRKIIETYCPEIEVIDAAETVLSAKFLVDHHKPDVVFLDINMPVLNGFDFLEQFNERSFMVVFVSAHDDYGINAVKAGAVDYLLKPVDIKELKQTVKKLLLMKNKTGDFVNKEILPSSDKLVIPTSHGFDIIMLDDIIRLEAEGCYTKIVLNDGKKIIVSRTLKDLENAIPKGKFFRVHKSHMVNLQFIKSFSKIDGNHVTMMDGSKIEISRRKAPEFFQEIKTVLNKV